MRIYRQLGCVGMVKKDIDLFENPKYFAIFFLIKRISAKGHKVRYKHLKYVLVKNHGDIDTDKVTLMKDIRKTIKFEEVDQGLLKSLEESVKLDVLNLTKKEYDDKIIKLTKVKDYEDFLVQTYEGKKTLAGKKKDFRFSFKSSLSNTLRLLGSGNENIIKKEWDDKENKKGNTYYCISDYGANLFYRYYCKWIVEYLPDNLIKEAHEKLKEIEEKIV